MSATQPSVDERRNRPDRRTRRVSFHYPERRSGFDRRGTAAPTASIPTRLLSAYRDSPVAIAVAVLAFVALSAADLLLTLRALEAGATEANPVMAALFEQGPLAAGAFKMTLAVGVAVVMWAGRRYRRVLELSLLATALMGAVLVYHLAVLP